MTSAPPLPDSPIQTAAPDRPTVLFDGHCVFCRSQTENLKRLAGRDRIVFVDFQQEGALDAFPGISYDLAMQAMWLILPDGRGFYGMEAAARAVALRPIIGAVAYLYYVPGLRQLLDAIYRLIAKRRYKLMGKAIERGECDGDVCKVHFH